MKNLRTSLQTRTDGFTIVELIVIAVVIVILSLIIFNTFNGRNRGYDAGIKSDLNNLDASIKAYVFTNDRLPSGLLGCSTNPTSPQCIEGACSGNCSWGAGEFIKQLATAKDSFNFTRGLYKPIGSSTKPSALTYYNLYPGAVTEKSSINYYCLVVVSEAGKPFYFSTEKGLFEPSNIGSASNNFNFLANCKSTNPDYNTRVNSTGNVDITPYMR